MATATVRVRGLKETVRAFNQLDRNLSKEVRDSLKKAAEPVAASAKAKIGVYRGASLGTIGPRAAGSSVFVTQRAKKVTGQRGDFGALQMRRMIEALGEHEADVMRAVEDALDDLTRSAG